MRLSADPVCAALLERLDRPLLISTVPATDEDGSHEPAVMSDQYARLGLRFVVDGGGRDIDTPATTVGRCRFRAPRQGG